MDRCRTLCTRVFVMTSSILSFVINAWNMHESFIFGSVLFRFSLSIHLHYGDINIVFTPCRRAIVVSTSILSLIGCSLCKKNMSLRLSLAITLRHVYSIKYSDVCFNFIYWTILYCITRHIGVKQGYSNVAGLKVYFVGLVMPLCQWFYWVLSGRKISRNPVFLDIFIFTLTQKDHLLIKVIHSKSWTLLVYTNGSATIKIQENKSDGSVNLVSVGSRMRNKDIIQCIKLVTRVVTFNTEMSGSSDNCALL